MKKPTVLLQALGVSIMAMFAASSANAATITLTGTIRDFNDTHPDFEGNVIKRDPGIVQSTLGADGKPVYAGNPKTLTTSGKTNFDQWYRDTPGVNLSQQYSITLDDSNTPGFFSYSNKQFFPIDNQLFGNERRSHNYHFTYEIASQFTYRGGETLKFSGDDDVWVFLNKELVLDLGGVHGELEESVNLDELANALKITKGKTYDFNLFFAERRTNQSRFTLTTSLALEPPSVPEPLTIGSTIVAAGLGLWMKRKQKAAHLA
ncbi:fibro-slime family protein [Calothrix brevissima NIES-22]|nr:fibro-slime family protein [Calothrix brevissima NIES-22]